MRDAVVIPFDQDQTLVITSDNSGAIGMKEHDLVQVPYETVGYYSFRVAVMECIAAKAMPIAVVLHNFCGDDPWDKLITGIQRGLRELHMENVTVTGSTESNFSLDQSAVGINVIGTRTMNDHVSREALQDKNVALIGLPLVGDEVISESDHIAPLSMCKVISALDDVIVWPVGSKGVLNELNRLFPGGDKITGSSKIDLLKSGGPSTSFLVVYPSELEGEIMEIAGGYFNKL